MSYSLDPDQARLFARPYLGPNYQQTTLVDKELTLKAPNTTKAEFANTVDQDETAHDELSHLDLHCLLSSPSIFNIIQFELKVFENFADAILPSAFLMLQDSSGMVLTGFQLFKIYSIE